MAEGRKVWLHLTKDTKIGIDADVAMRMTQREFARLYRDHVVGASRRDAADWAYTQVTMRLAATEVVTAATRAASHELAELLDVAMRNVFRFDAEPEPEPDPAPEASYREPEPQEPEQEEPEGSTFNLTLGPDGTRFDATWQITRYEDGPPMVKLDDVARFVYAWPQSKNDAYDYLCTLLDRAEQEPVPEMPEFTWEPATEESKA